MHLFSNVGINLLFILDDVQEILFLYLRPKVLKFNYKFPKFYNSFEKIIFFIFDIEENVGEWTIDESALWTEICFL